MATCTDSVWDGIEAIVLDAVGTLIEPWPPVAEVYAAAARRQGIDLEPSRIHDRFLQHFRSQEDADSKDSLTTDEPTERRRWHRIVAGTLGDVPDPERAFRELWDHFGRGEAWRCFADVTPALRALDGAGIPVAIASNFDARLRGVVAGLPELAGRVGPLVISSEVGYRKPHPAFFQAVCRRLGVAAERILFIGDELENDVLGANGAGLRGFWLDRKGRPSRRDVPQAGDLVSIVSRRNG